MTAALRAAAAPPDRLGFGLYLVPGYPTWDVSLAAAEAAAARGIDFLEFPVLTEPEFSGSTGGVVAEAIALAGEHLDPHSPRLRDWLRRVPAAVGIVYRSAWPIPGDWRAGTSVLSACSGLLCEHDAQPFAEYAETARRHGIPLVPTVRASAEGLADTEVLHHGDGFVYCALSGETGSRGDFGDGLERTLDSVHDARPDLPAYAAFGIRTPGDVAEIAARGADGFIVGSHALALLGTAGLDGFEGWLDDMLAARTGPAPVSAPRAGN
ncbi:tryptophan synthase subunit alpha [Amycolatopsis rubida]|uniref:tryptophan synthase n=1 Tax=Amycolatopsis rubida TaxID=112413 RepID=A0A1I6AHL6_9PSEU|nr:tryptophan synthase subunit alpha [Amycolatopsis rubida]SFQ68145.1 tryptophan synthase, alpha chain [Amycolatopsis rubida]